MKEIKIAHSPDSDDAFMFYALVKEKITHPDYTFSIERRDIEELNQEALKEVYDLTAISMHAYAHLSDKYVLTASGASMAEKDYGPMVISAKDYSPDDIKNLTVAVPGEWTTACLVLKIFCPTVKYVCMPFDEIMDAVKNNDVDAGLIIHEGQLQYENLGFQKVVSLIDIWKNIAGDLPLPLGGNAIKKSLGYETIKELSSIQKQSIVYANEHLADARDYAMQFKRDLSQEEAEKYLSWYANNRTLDMGDIGKQAIEVLFSHAFEAGLLPSKINLEIV